MQLFFIRHGQSENNLLWTQTGTWDGRNDDPDLTPLGRRQAAALAKFVSQPGVPAGRPAPAVDTQNIYGFAWTHLYCSLMIRAIATGAFLARALGLPLVGLEDVHEVGGIHQKDERTGARIGLPGKSRSYFATHFPGLILPDSVGEEGWWNRPHEQEAEAAARARRFLGDLLRRHGESGDRVAIISHGGFYNHLVNAILDLPEDDRRWFSINNTAITRFDFDQGLIWVSYMNRVDHLPRELIT